MLQRIHEAVASSGSAAGEPACSAHPQNAVFQYGKNLNAVCRLLPSRIAGDPSANCTRTLAQSWSDWVMGTNSARLICTNKGVGTPPCPTYVPGCNAKIRQANFDSWLALNLPETTLRLGFVEPGQLFLKPSTFEDVHSNLSDSLVYW